jgi:glutathione synthase/RimK-type ligase-like ATP-grasp enzyme
MKKIKVLITGAGGSAAHNFVDSLNLTENYRCYGMDMKPEHLELIELEKKYIVPGVKDPKYVEKLNKIIEKEKIDFVHPQPDVEVAFLAKHSAQINARMFLPSSEAIELCHDKMLFNEVMSESGVPVPKAVHITSPTVLRAALDQLMKTESKVWLRAIRGAGSRGSLPINSFYQGDAWIDYWKNFRGIDYGDFMASEFLPGKEYAWQSLWYEGVLVTSMARERIEYIFGNLTPSGQTSSPSVAKTVCSDVVNKTGRAAVKAADKKPHGVYCVDMKEDSGGTPKVTEINVGRFFTTSNFFAHAGLNMPDMYMKLGMGLKLSEQPKQLNPLPDNLYWVRMIDMGYKLVKGREWQSVKI